MHARRPASPASPPAGAAGFTLIELLVVIAIVALLSSILLPALSSAKSRSQSIFCLNSVRQLNLAWLLYAHDHDDHLAYNLGGTEIKQMLSENEQYNWANSVLNWELDPDNTNAVLNTEAALGSYTGHNPQVFRCPADSVLSSIQRAAGWSTRSRSISMNAMVGNAGEFTRNGHNLNNPYYRQFWKLSEIRAATRIFVFIEEHPDSINDGYFLNRGHVLEWHDLPASYHHGGANLSFADGHLETRRWLFPSTRPPARPDGAQLPISIPPNERADYDWLFRRTSISGVEAP